MNNIVFEKIYFSCPDCETGRMRKQKLGQLENYFKCNECETGLLAPLKLMKLLTLPYSSIASKTVNISVPPHSSNASTQ
jgi:predicted RNA-binding Zn-ribbon protein involved in translation (DUF1610 family)